MLRKGQVPIVVVNVLILVVFGTLFLQRANHEFLIYVGVIVALGSLILSTNERMKYPNGLLWGLTLWSAMHMAGGGVLLEDGRLYELILVPLSEEYPIFRYDQLAHIVGFAVATLMAYHLLTPLLKSSARTSIPLAIVVIMAGLGFGALNEILEFTATLVTPETGVGGYINTSLDQVSNLIGALLAYGLIRSGKWPV